MLGGNVGIGADETPDGLLSVGSASQFQVNATGVVTTSGNISTSGSGTITSAGTLTASTGLTVSANGATITGGIDNNNGGITEAGSLGGVSTLSASGLLTTTGNITTTSTGSVSSATTITAGTGLTVTSGNATITAGNIALSAGALTTAGTTRLTNGGALQNITGLTITSGGATITTGDLALTAGGLSTAGTTRLTNAGALQNITGLTITSGGASVSGGITVSSGGIAVTGNSTISGSLGGITGLTVVSGGATITAGNLALTAGLLSTAGTTRLTNAGALQNITGLTIISGGATVAGGLTVSSGGIAVTGNSTISGSLSGITGLTVASGGASISGGLNNNSGGITNTGAISGATTIAANSTISTSGNINVTGSGVYQIDGSSGNTITCGSNNYLSNIDLSGGIIIGNNGCRGIGLSDERLKENIVSLQDDILQRIVEINTVTFDFDCSNQIFYGSGGALVCDHETQTGVIAQQLAEVFPELVYQGDDGYYRVRYEALNIYTLKAVTQLASAVNIVDNKLVLNTAARSGLSVLGNSGRELFTVDAEGNARFDGTITADGVVNETQVLAAIDQRLAEVFGAGLEVSGYTVFDEDVDFNRIVKFMDDVILTGDTLFTGRPVFNNDTGGFATVEQGDTEVRIEFEHEFPSIPVVNVSNIDGQFINYTYKDLDETGFTLVVQFPAEDDIEFSWTAFAISDALTTLSSQDSLDN